MKEWKVIFSPDSREQGKELAINLEFLWGGRRWKLPSLYLFEEGVMLDFLLEGSIEELDAFIGKWDLLHEQEHDYSELEREQMEQEHPLWMDFTPTLCLNGQSVKYKGCTGRCWIPAACLDGNTMEDRSMQAVMEHYSLDEKKGWGFRRCRFLFTEEKQRDLQSMELELRQNPRTVFGPLLSAPKAGTMLDFYDPDGREHRLTVHEIALEQLIDGQGILGFYQVLPYTVEPDMALTLRDTQPSDCGFAPILLLPKAKGQKIALSSLRKEPVTATDWQLLFTVKTVEDIRINQTRTKEDGYETL